MLDLSTLYHIANSLATLRETFDIDVVDLVLSQVEARYTTACEVGDYRQANALSSLHSRLTTYHHTHVSGPMPQVDTPYEPVWMSERLKNRLGFVKSGLRHDVEQQYERGWLPGVAWKIDGVIEQAERALQGGSSEEGDI